MKAIFHITEPGVWRTASTAGSFTESTHGKSLEQVGFIHCSFADQVEVVANFIYRDWQGELLLLQIDPERVTAEIRVENLDGGEDEFPHIYGELPTAAVTAIYQMSRHDEGRWALPSDI